MTTLNEHPAQCIQDINKKYKKKVVHGWKTCGKTEF
jgi:hypothetical protein